MTRWTRPDRRASDGPLIPPLQPLDSTEEGSRSQRRRSTFDGPDQSEEELRPAERWRKILAVAEALSSERLAGQVLAASLAYPLAAYDQFRRDVPVRPPPKSQAPPPPITVLVDARGAAPFLLRATLRSLQDQSISEWTAHVQASAVLCEAPVASFADVDARIRFVPPGAEVPSGTGYLVIVDAGTVLDPEALAWFAFTLLRTGAAAAFADHDHGVADPAFRMLRADPVLFGTFDEALIMESAAPAVVALSRPSCGEICSSLDRREALIKASRAGRVAHIPRLIATLLSLPLIARAGRTDPTEPVAIVHAGSPASSAVPVAAAPRQDRIAVVIPTRDGAGLLARAIDTLRATATYPERLDIVVVDNRSVTAEAAALFGRMTAEGAARVVPFESPFNWSLASNLGAAASDAPLITFVNNDVEMLSPGWDDVVAEALSRPHVGVVGARLLYPDRTIQHAGIAVGFGPVGTEHEGRGAPAADPGPGNRYVTTHAVSAVTGAFLGVRRTDFQQLDGFDAARLMIAHSDVDLCLRMRQLGKVILYCPAIQAVHHEGATRGRNQTQAAIAWDEGERLDLLDRWGEALANDPGISPYWRRGERPFELLREPTIREVLEHIDQSASSFPWRPAGSAGR